MGYFQLPFGIRIAGGEPLDGDRYIAINTVSRDLTVTQGRAHDGLQVYVEDIQKLYILKGTTNADWVEIAVGGDLTYYFIENTPTTVWNVTHNLGKFPSVTILDSNDIEVEALVSHIDNNSLIINFNAAFAGKAAIN